MESMFLFRWTKQCYAYDGQSICAEVKSANRSRTEKIACNTFVHDIGIYFDL